MMGMHGKVLWVLAITSRLNLTQVDPGSFLTSWLQRITNTNGMRKVSSGVCIFLCTEVDLSERNLEESLMWQRCLTKQKC